MQFTVSAEILRPLVEAAAELAPGSGKIPQLEAVRLDVGDPDHLVVSASNRVESIRLERSGVTNPKPGSVFVPSVNLLRAVKAAKKDDITVAWNPPALHATVKWGTSVVKLPTEPPENQRAFKRFNDKKPYATVPGSVLASLIKRTVFAVQTDFASRTLGGVSVKVKQDCLELAATDGRRLALAKRSIQSVGTGTEAVVSPMPPKVVDRLHADGENVDIQLLNNVLAIRGSAGETTRQLLTGVFPDYEKHVPWTMPKQTKIDRKAFIELVKHANLLKVSGGIDTYFTFADNTLCMAAKASVEGMTEASMVIDWPYGPIKVNLDHTFIDQALKTLESDLVIVGLESAEAAVTIREDTEDFDTINVIMPKVGN